MTLISRFPSFAARVALGGAVIAGSTIGIVACGGDDTVAAAPDAATADATSPDAPSSADSSDAGTGTDTSSPKEASAQCNALTLDGVPVATMRAVTETAPAPAGGAIEDGTYFALDYVIYGRPNAVPAAPFVRSKLVISAGEWQSVSGAATSDAGAGNNETVQATTATTMVTLKKTCPAQPAATYGYSVITTDAGKKLLRYFNGTAEVGALTYEKQ